MRVQTSDLPVLLSVTTRIQTLDLKTSPSALPARQKKKFGWTTREDSNLIQNRYTMLLQQSRKINFRVNSCEDANLRICNNNNNNNNKRFIPRQYPTVQRRLQKKNLNINT